MVRIEQDRLESMLRKAISRCICEGLPWCDACRADLAALKGNAMTFGDWHEIEASAPEDAACVIQGDRCKTHPTCLGMRAALRDAALAPIKRGVAEQRRRNDYRFQAQRPDMSDSEVDAELRRLDESDEA